MGEGMAQVNAVIWSWHPNDFIWNERCHAPAPPPSTAALLRVTSRFLCGISVNTPCGRDVGIIVWIEPLVF